MYSFFGDEFSKILVDQKPTLVTKLIGDSKAANADKVAIKQEESN